MYTVITPKRRDYVYTETLATSKKKKNKASMKNRLKFKILTFLFLGILNISKANFHKFKIEVKNEGKEITDYEIYFQNQDKIFVPNDVLY